MRGTWLVFRAELGRTCATRSTWIIAVLLALLAYLRALASVAASASSTSGAVSSGAAWAPLADGWRAGLVLGALVLLTVGARSLAGDCESGVLRMAVTRTASRSAAVLGRLALAPVLIVWILTMTGISAWLATQRAGDFGPLIEDGYELLSTAELRAEFLRALVATLPALFATFALGLFVSSLARTATSSVAFAMGVFLAFDLFKDALGDGRFGFFPSFVPTLADTSPWAELAGIARGFSDSGYSEALWRQSLIVPGPEALLLALGACWVLSRRAL